VETFSSAAFSYSNVGGGLRPGAGNISLDPEFLDAPGGDYALSPQSPCIAAGRSATDMGAVPFERGDPLFLRGDSDSSGSADISDAVSILTYLFLGGRTPDCLRAADIDGSEAIEITDPVYLLGYLFLGSSPPPQPFPDCGRDPGGSVSCLRHPACE
jgi:hypothetical protein